MSAGTIVLLNGTSSAGKTSIARALQDIMDEPWLHTGIDEYAPHLPAKFTTITDERNPTISDYLTLIYREPAERIVEDVADRGEVAYGTGELVDVRLGAGAIRLVAARYRGIAAMADAGVNLVVDDLFFDPRALQAAVSALAFSDTLFVGLRLPLAVAEQRERARGDRGPGGARLFYDRVHAHGLYDLELDTSILTPMKCAEAIQHALAGDTPRRAVSELHRRVIGSSPG
jgi:chloramphenicol 3-O phosphotransferase